ncbi:MAG: hypothetical protein JW953_16215 [Anaerolineae bacterium]|nr:hypothetical protein [Anaerolineae bacterium]
MDDVCTYRLAVRGQVDENVFNVTSPLQITVAQREAAATVFTICADQSGLIGLVRHLHWQGFVILSIYREQ